MQTRIIRDYRIKIKINNNNAEDIHFSFEMDMAFYRSNNNAIRLEYYK